MKFLCLDLFARTKLFYLKWFLKVNFAREKKSIISLLICCYPRNMNTLWLNCANFFVDQLVCLLTLVNFFKIWSVKAIIFHSSSSTLTSCRDTVIEKVVMDCLFAITTFKYFSLYINAVEYWYLIGRSKHCYFAYNCCTYAD